MWDIFLFFTVKGIARRFFFSSLSPLSKVRFFVFFFTEGVGLLSGVLYSYLCMCGIYPDKMTDAELLKLGELPDIACALDSDLQIDRLDHLNPTSLPVFAAVRELQ